MENTEKPKRGYFFYVRVGKLKIYKKNSCACVATRFTVSIVPRIEKILVVRLSGKRWVLKKYSIQVPIYMALIILKPPRQLGPHLYDL